MFVTAGKNLNIWMDSLWASLGRGLRNCLLLVKSFLLTSLGIFSLLCCQLNRTNATPAVNQNVTLSCRNISTTDGFTYTVMANAQSALVTGKDCEQGWYNEFLTDGQHDPNQTRHSLVVNEDINKLTLSTCSKIYHRVTCHETGERLNTTYYVNNDTNTNSSLMEQMSHKTRNHICIIISLIALVLVVGILIIRYKRNRRSYNMNEHQPGSREENSTQNSQHDHAVDIPMTSKEFEVVMNPSQICQVNSESCKIDGITSNAA